MGKDVVAQMHDSPFQIFDFTQIQVQIQVGPVFESNLRGHLAAETARMREALKQRQLNDTRKAVAVVEFLGEYKADPVARRLQADWMKENTELLRMVTGSMAFVVPNGVLRGALTAVLWVSPLPMPVGLHENMELALDWAIAEVMRNNWGEIANELLLEGPLAVERRKAVGSPLPRASLLPGRG